MRSQRQIQKSQLQIPGLVPVDYESGIFYDFIFGEN